MTLKKNNDDLTFIN